MNNVKISACIITYNQEAFIRDCLEGAINQKVDFEYEIVIGEDNSSDKTRQICIEFAEKYPNLIKFYPREKNLGMIGNWIKTIQDCKGKYIALCEGDDYWTDPLKLQKQVDFLEANPDYNICFHNVQLFNQEENKFSEDTITREVLETTTIENLARGNYIHTPSVVLRNNFTIPLWFSKSPIGDWVLYMLATKDKKIKKIEENMAVYRLHNTSIWAMKSAKFRILNTIKSLELLKSSNELPPEIKLMLKSQIENLKKQLPKNSNIIDRLLNKSKRIFNG